MKGQVVSMKCRASEEEAYVESQGEGETSDARRP
jgi:hypothetical protein